jgi:hypothetical protein
MTQPTELFAKFNGPELFLEQGRLIFSVLHAFAIGGVKIHLFDNFTDKQLDKYGKLVYDIKGLTPTKTVPANPAQFLFLYDKPDELLHKHIWSKAVQVRFDMFSSFLTSNPIIMPFPMHPVHSGTTAHDLERLRTRERQLRIFFSGDTNGYGREWVHYPKTKMPRLPIVNCIKERLSDSLVVVHDISVLDGFKRKGYSRKCVITASSEVRTADADWLATLAQADFFLSPPGIVMPMCHNIIEAMAVGTIPITNYPEWLDPHLENMKNCIVFDDCDDLIAKLRQALAMEPHEIVRMRANVIDYHDRHLRPQTFADRVQGSPDKYVPILIYTERNMARYAKKLGRHSILMQGTAKPREGHWFKRILATYLN